MDKQPFKVTIKETLIHEAWVQAVNAEQARIVAIDNRALWRHKPEHDWIDTGAIYDAYDNEIFA